MEMKRLFFWCFHQILAKWGKTYKWQYSFDLNGPFLDIINGTYNFDSLLWKVNLADTIYLRLFSVCNITESWHVFFFSQTLFLCTDNLIQFRSIGFCVWIFAKGHRVCWIWWYTLDRTSLGYNISCQWGFIWKESYNCRWISPYVKVLNQIQNIAVDQNLDIRRSGNVSLIGMQFEGGGNFYPIIKTLEIYLCITWFWKTIFKS